MGRRDSAEAPPRGLDPVNVECRKCGALYGIAAPRCPVCSLGNSVSLLVALIVVGLCFAISFGAFS